MSELTLDTNIHGISLRINGFEYANQNVIERVTITYGCTDGTAPGFGATFSPRCDVVINSDSIIGGIAVGAFKQGVVFSVHTDLLDAPELGQFLIQEPPMFTEDYQMTFSGEGMLGTIYDSTYMDFKTYSADNYGIIPFYSADPSTKTVFSLFENQFDASVSLPSDSFLPYYWKTFNAYVPINVQETNSSDAIKISWENITAREWLAGIALLLGCNVIEAFGELKFVPLYQSYEERNTFDYFNGNEYNGGFEHTDLFYQPSSLLVTTATMKAVKKVGNSTMLYPAYAYNGEVTYTTFYNPTRQSGSHIEYDLNISIQWVGHTLRQAYWGTKKATADSTYKLPNKPFVYTPSNWDFSGYHEMFRPGNFINVRKEIRIPDSNPPRYEYEDVLVYIMEMTLDWNGNFNITVNSTYNGDADGVTSSISSSANGHGSTPLSNLVNHGLINGVRIEDGTIWARKINVHDLSADNAFIGFLNANEALLGELRAEHAWIKTLAVGTLDAQSVSTVLMNAEYALIGEGAIKSATIIREGVDRSSILRLCTSFIEVSSQSGNMNFKDNTIQINDEHGVTRVQIGKDADGDYDLYLWDENGRLMWSASGLAEAGVKSKIIRNDMIADDAGIEGKKIDTETLIAKINNTGYKFKSSIFSFDGTGQSFESKFEELSYNLHGTAQNAEGYRLIVNIDGYLHDLNNGGSTNAYLTAQIEKAVYDEEHHKLTYQDITSNYKASDFVWRRYSDHESDWVEKVTTKGFDYVEDSQGNPVTASIAHARQQDNEPSLALKEWVYKAWDSTSQSYVTVPAEQSVTHCGDTEWNRRWGNVVSGRDYNMRYVNTVGDPHYGMFIFPLVLEDVCIGCVFECTARVGRQMTLHAEPYQITPLVYTAVEQQANLANMDEATLGVAGMSATDVGEYTATVALQDGYIWYDETSDPKDVPWVIEPGEAPAELPSQSGTLTYNASSQTPTWNNYDPNVLDISGDTSGTNAGTYTAIFTPNENYTWEDGTRTPKPVNWVIGKAQGNITLSKNSVTLTTADPTDTVTFTDATGTVSVISADPSVATASVSGNTITITQGTQPDPSWEQKTWNGSLTSFSGSDVWEYNGNYYYSNNGYDYVLNKSTSTWQSVSWNKTLYGNGIWTDGNNIYHSYQNKQYVLNKSTLEWQDKSWGDVSNYYGSNVWTDGNNVYLSSGSTHYVLNKSNASWERKTWNGLTLFDGYNVWTDGDNIYYSASGVGQYVLNTSTSTWSQKTWVGTNSIDGADVWKDGNTIYYSGGAEAKQYVLNKSTSTWTRKTWGGTNSVDGEYIWTDGDNIYYSYSSTQRVLVQ